MHQTTHQVMFEPATAISQLTDASVDLVVTSPPYPMIAMWDACFTDLDPAINSLLKREQGLPAFHRMHDQLKAVWTQMVRVMKPGAFACINIGDAARTLDKTFTLYPNHARIITDLLDLKLTPLPAILWRKPTNAPNKFMGSGMLPAGAYITLEHEYILIFRKGDKRVFATPAEKIQRRQSAIFWEERNTWFSDVWFGLIGTRQKLGDKEARKRSGAFPFELAYRLINMFSVYGDTVLDPFLGTGTTSAAAIATGRSSIGMEIDPNLKSAIREALTLAPDTALDRLTQRIYEHTAFIAERIQAGKSFKHQNAVYQIPVMTAQEKELTLYAPAPVPKHLFPGPFRVTLDPLDPDSFAGRPLPPPVSDEPSPGAKNTPDETRPEQLSLF
ncbi:MAG: modification methylase [Deltaproteobacteria bacterium]|nr:MAG: modification methylase [Deltaproteobacteria bacterium]